ncbi:MAG: DUF2284 domain-containing protein [Oscillospiraceae bacterium]|nr:DUF2284 domain-containing protein [Oscillospiraceae bacterium]
MRTSPFEPGFFQDDLASLGVTSWGSVRPGDIPLSPEIRKICEDNTCRSYGTTWACPPAVGTFEECRDIIRSYSGALVFSTVCPLEDSFDFEGMARGHREFKKVCDRVGEKLEKPFLLLSNEGCIRCRECTYPEAPCRFPEKLYPSLEGFGVLVGELASMAGVKYRNPGAVTYFGMICWD